MGAGVAGLFTAVQLIEKGYKNLTLIADQFENLTSHSAGGIWEPSFEKDASAEAQMLLDEVGRTSFHTYRCIAQGDHPILRTGFGYCRAIFSRGVILNLSLMLQIN